MNHLLNFLLLTILPWIPIMGFMIKLISKALSIYNLFLKTYIKVVNLWALGALYVLFIFTTSRVVFMLYAQQSISLHNGGWNKTKNDVNPIFLRPDFYFYSMQPGYRNSISIFFDFFLVMEKFMNNLHCLQPRLAWKFAKKRSKYKSSHLFFSRQYQYHEESEDELLNSFGKQHFERESLTQC